MKTKVMTTSSLQFVYTNIDVIDNKATGIYKDQSPAQTPSPPITPLSTSPTSPQMFNGGPTILSAASELSPTISSNMTITNNNNNHNNTYVSNEYHREEVRLNTFTNNWPHSYLNVTKLATIGFYYIGPYDTVKCYFCKVEIGRWEPEDNELTEHIRWSQNCPLLKRRETNNIPLVDNELDRILPPISYDVCGPCGIGGGIVDVRPGAYAESSFTPSNTSNPSSPSSPPGRASLMALTIATTPSTASTTSTSSSSAMPVPPPLPSLSLSSAANNSLQPSLLSLAPPQQRLQLPPPLLLPPPPPSPAQQFSPRFVFEPFHEQQSISPRHPVHSEYAIEADRLRSFDDWPKTMKQKPKELSDAGFFYTRTGDRVKCFSCAGGLRDWDECDIPWEQHAIWFDQCEYLKLMKGQDYIDEVQRKYRALEEAASNSNATQNNSEQQSMATGGENNRRIQLQTQSNTSTNNNNNNNNSRSNNSNNDNDNSNGRVGTSMAASTSSASLSSMAMATNRSGMGPSTGVSQLEEQQKPQVSNTGGNRDERLCRICFVNEYNTIFNPCGHVVACAKCASSVNKCPMCRKPFDRIMKVFFP